jgi:hypothetical protein
MANPIDCSTMSHASCLPAPELAQAVTSAPALAVEKAGAPALPAGTSLLRDAEGEPASGGASYDCVNDCISSQGVTSLLSGAIIGLGCFAAPPACPVFIGAGAGAMLGACEAACVDLESKP